MVIPEKVQWAVLGVVLGAVLALAVSVFTGADAEAEAAFARADADTRVAAAEARMEAEWAESGDSRSYLIYKIWWVSRENGKPVQRVNTLIKRPGQFPQVTEGDAVEDCIKEGCWGVRGEPLPPPPTPAAAPAPGPQSTDEGPTSSPS